MMGLTIEKGIPIPQSRSNFTDQFNILDELDIGDSILFPLNEWKRARNQAYIRKPKAFTFRKVKGGYRCWRIQ